jgi:hypothetical protein
MVTNKLQLISNKTELLVLASSYFSKHSSDFQLQIDNNWISPSGSDKNIGILFDQHLNMETHVAGISKLQTYGLNAFSVATPTLWNKLPSHITTSKSLNLFRKNVKTFLFKLYFNY